MATRKKTIKGITPALLDEVEKIQRDQTRGDRYRYRVAKRVAAILDVDAEDRFGPERLPFLAEKLDRTVSYLYRLSAVADRWCWEGAKGWLDRGLRFSHLVVVARLDDANDLLEQAASRGLGVRALKSTLEHRRASSSVGGRVEESDEGTDTRDTVAETEEEPESPEISSSCTPDAVNTCSQVDVRLGNCRVCLRDALWVAGIPTAAGGVTPVCDACLQRAIEAIDARKRNAPPLTTLAS